MPETHKVCIEGLGPDACYAPSKNRVSGVLEQVSKVSQTTRGMMPTLTGINNNEKLKAIQTDHSVSAKRSRVNPSPLSPVKSSPR